MYLRREYAKGSIIKVRAKQFMVRSLSAWHHYTVLCCYERCGNKKRMLAQTFQDVTIEPGPTLNVVLGPNGARFFAQNYTLLASTLQPSQYLMLACLGRAAPRNCTAPLQRALTQWHWLAGTGKSSLVCALCLGLGGNTKVQCLQTPALQCPCLCSEPCEFRHCLILQECKRCLVPLSHPQPAAGKQRLVHVCCAEDRSVSWCTTHSAASASS